MSTLGYGKLVPRTLYTNLFVTLESFLGVLEFALLSGLMFAKFSRPTARVVFSKWAVVTTRDGVRSLLFRIANERLNQVVEAQVRVSLLRQETTLEGEVVRRFYDLDLSRSRSPIFALTWTLIHPITPASPLYQLTKEDLEKMEGEVVISFTGSDETFVQTVQARHSYSPREILFDHRFLDIISIGADGNRLIDYRKLHDTEPLKGLKSQPT